MNEITVTLELSDGLLSEAAEMAGRFKIGTSEFLSYLLEGRLNLICPEVDSTP